MKILTKVLALALVLTMALSLAACGGSTTPDPTKAPETQAPEVKPTQPVIPEQTDAPSDKVVYTVKVVDEAGNPVVGAFVQLCLDTCTPRATDANGVATYEMDVAADYKISFVTPPAGYVVEEAYHFAEGTFEITITLKAA